MSAGWLCADGYTASYCDAASYCNAVVSTAHIASDGYPASYCDTVVSIADAASYCDVASYCDTVVSIAHPASYCDATSFCDVVSAGWLCADGDAAADSYAGIATADPARGAGMMGKNWGGIRHENG